LLYRLSYVGGKPANIASQADHGKKNARLWPTALDHALKSPKALSEARLEFFLWCKRANDLLEAWIAAQRIPEFYFVSFGADEAASF
jgi:hypothetical protein